MEKAISGQAELLEFMGLPDAYEPRPGSVERIDTHASVVFLAGPFAYKIKRAVKYPFLDFSTLEKRRVACLNELKINRRTAPELYLEVLPITIVSDGLFRIGGDGNTVEWALKMRRFDQAKLYDRMAEEGRLQLASMPALAQAIARFHGAADRALTAGQSVDPLAQVLEDNLTTLAGEMAVVAPEVLDSLADSSRRKLGDLAPLLESRTRDGYVRHCHGDLHLRNIVEIEGKPVLFDAIEFDDRLATIDVLYDLAFLLMDLGARNLPLHANAILNAYLDASAATGNLIGLSALPLLLSLRAMIRAKVEALRARVGPEGEQAEAVRRAANYCLLARDYLVTRPARLIAIGGLSGSGKSSVAKMLAPKIGTFPGAVHIRSDVERKRLFGIDLGQALPPSAYTQDVTAIVYAICRKRARMALRGNRTVILDAVHARPEEREAAAALARDAGVPFTGLWLEAPRDVLRERVGNRVGDVSDATLEIVDQQLDYEIGPQSFAVIDARGPLEQVVGACLAELGAA